MRGYLRRALHLDEPDRHLTGPQFVVACLIAIQAALFWGMVARNVALGGAILPMLIYPAWITPRAQETPLFRFLMCHAEAAFLAGFMTLARHATGP